MVDDGSSDRLLRRQFSFLKFLYLLLEFVYDIIFKHLRAHNIIFALHLYIEARRYQLALFINLR